MEVKVRFFSFFRNIAGCRKVEVQLAGPLPTCNDLLVQLSETLGERFAEEVGSPDNPSALLKLIYLNGKNILQQEGLATKLQEGDEIDFLPPMEGG